MPWHGTFCKALNKAASIKEGTIRSILIYIPTLYSNKQSYFTEFFTGTVRHIFSCPFVTSGDRLSVNVHFHQMPHFNVYTDPFHREVWCYLDIPQGNS